MHVALQMRRAFGQGGETRGAVQRDVQFARSAADLEFLHPVDEIAGQFAFFDMFQKSAFDIHIGHHALAAHFIAVGQDDPDCAAIPDQDAVNPVACANFATHRRQ